MSIVKSLKSFGNMFLSNKRKLVLFILFIFVFIGIAAVGIFFVVKKIQGINLTLQDSQVSTAGQKEMEINFLDIGQGDATLVQFPNGEKMIIDCAKDAVVLEALGRALSFNDHVIEHMIVTNPDLDHYGGCIDVLKRFEVKHIYHSGFKKEDRKWKTFLETAAAEPGATFHTVTSSYNWSVGAVQIQFLYPNHDIAIQPAVPGSKEKATSNNASIITKISLGSQDILFPGDAEAPLEEYLVATYGNALDVEVVKLAHHCSQSSSVVNFLSATSPLEAVCSSGVGNAYGHPSPRVLKRAERAGARIWRTDTHGDIRMYVTTSTIEVK